MPVTVEIGSKSIAAAHHYRLRRGDNSLLSVCLPLFELYTVNVPCCTAVVIEWLMVHVDSLK